MSTVLSLTTVAVLRYLQAHFATKTISPTLQEIADACFLSKTATKYHVDRLRETGYVTYEPNKLRTIRLVERRGAAD